MVRVLKTLAESCGTDRHAARQHAGLCLQASPCATDAAAELQATDWLPASLCWPLAAAAAAAAAAVTACAVGSEPRPPAPVAADSAG